MLPEREPTNQTPDFQRLVARTKYRWRVQKLWRFLVGRGYDPVALARHTDFYAPARARVKRETSREEILTYARQIAFKDPAAKGGPDTKHGPENMIFQLRKTRTDNS